MIIGDSKKNVVRTIGQMDPGSATRRGPLPATGSALAAIVGMGTLGPWGALAGLVPLIPPALGTMAKKIGNKITKRELAAIQHSVLNKGQPDLAKIITNLYTKYSTNVGGTAAALAGGTSDDVADTVSYAKAMTKLEDMLVE